MSGQSAYMGPYSIVKPDPKVPDARDDPNSREGRLRTLCNDAAKKAGVPFMEALVYGYAMTVLQEAKIWHAFRGNADALVEVAFTPNEHTKVVVSYRDRDWNIQTVRST